MRNDQARNIGRKALEQLASFLKEQPEAIEAAIVREILLSLAGHQKTDLMRVRELTPARLKALRRVLTHLHHLSDEELIAAAEGSLELHA